MTSGSLTGIRLSCAAAVTALILVAGWTVRPSGQQLAGQVDLAQAANEILVKFRPQAAQGQRNARLAAVAAQRLRRFEALDVDHLRLPANVSVANAIAALLSDPNVEAAQPNYIREAVATAPPNDPFWLSDQLWGLQKIQAPAAWTNFGTGNGTVVVADIDTGVNYNHPDLAANMWRNPGEIAGNGIDDDSNGYVDDVYGIDTRNHDGDPMDDHGHGTHTAGTIAGIGNNGVGVAGVIWNAKILACKFLSSGGSGSDADAIACFNYLVLMKNRGVNIRVTSNSWGSFRQGSPPTVMLNAINNMGNAGIISMFAAGNYSADNDATPFDPASLSPASIVSVAASDGNDNLAGFSNYGATSVDIAAPGVGIISTYGADYGILSGTSMATPHVAGAAAFIATIKPNATVAQIKGYLLNNVDQGGQWTGKVASLGRLNLFAAAVASNGNSLPQVSVSAPTAGSTFEAPASIQLQATASDSDGTVTQVAFYSNGALLATDTTSPYSYLYTGVAAGSYTLTAIATDNLGATKTSDGVPITVTSPAAGGTRTNVALASNGGTASASSTYSGGYAASGAINGDRKGSPWGNGGGWNDGTSGTFPDWLEVTFNADKTIDEVSVFSVQDNYTAPSDPGATTTFTQYGLRDFQVQYWDGSQFVAVPNGTISSNTLVWRRVTFPALTTRRIRVYVTQALSTWSRITEVEAWSPDGASQPPVTPPSTRTNVALASNGGVPTVSSTHSAGYAASGAINGDRTGAPWGNGAGWNDGTSNSFPDWLEVAFNGSKSIDEISVFSVQDNFSAPVEPTDVTTFTQYGLRDFLVQYWDGTQFVTVPGGSISGNTLVWRKVAFTAVTTTRIRIYVTQALNAWTRIAEVEAWTSDGSSPPPPPPPPTTAVNVALAGNGGVATASSTYNGNFSASAANNGNRTGSPASGGYWNDGTANTFPDSIEVAFNGTKTINEISVFSVQDNFMSPIEPDATTAFTSYGVRDFQVQYWDGNQWVTVPGGTITGNALVWRRVTFTSVATTKIRILVTSALDTWTRIAEIEAWQP